ncbi:hypothetical protein K493DRAFT_299726 [Basidiobolus meristosporus CBS 931.73]|uniref:Uncharacterized protein n=1 Tax=Basidiobolus meristosporus CBS 931.73 TaxID=1314790 RepID=A0A1Y1XGP1_9FUNG|nr:hypothetical protein K493DRAFT_307424 [Basidiobolus meristosporus CBS 931.73]ORX98784.1 hypothetical protein K493DRAFT_299726 [Basidiobolus meristosporus CBS 931.73]|eukprot:ORX84566.1 hypothetical protein K493DRAFT_307424 [Basidiobolus meristosporus CBS 931.73]
MQFKILLITLTLELTAVMAALENHCYVLKRVTSTPTALEDLETIEQQNCFSDWDITRKYCSTREMRRNANCDTTILCSVEESYNEVIAAQNHFGGKCTKF